jgi:hypothetical protein
MSRWLFLPATISYKIPTCLINSAKTSSFSRIAQLTNLKAVNISSTEFGDRDLAYLRELPNLRHLEMAMTNVNCVRLLNEPFLEKLNLLDVSAIDDGYVMTRGISRIEKIQQLGMAGCGIMDEHCVALAKCKSMKVLTLAVNRSITDRGVASLSPLKQLEWLDLSRTSVTPACTETLKLFPNLKKIEMNEVIHWTGNEYKKFETIMKKHNPEIEIILQDQPTYDTSTSIPGLPWKGRGLVPHINFFKM